MSEVTPERLDGEGGPLPGGPVLSFAALAELAGQFPRVPRRELRCHPGVARWLMLVLPEAEPEFPGSIGALTGVPVIENPEFEPGAWEIREDGEVTASGHVNVPPWVTKPIALDVPPLPRLIDRYYPWFPYAPLPPAPMAGLSSIV